MGGGKRVDKFKDTPHKKEKPSLPDLNVAECGLCDWKQTGYQPELNALERHVKAKHKKKLEYQCFKCLSPQPDHDHLEWHKASCTWKRNS